MSYPQQPGNWSDPSWPAQQPPYQDSAPPASPAGYSGYPGYGYGPPAPVPAGPPTNGMAVAAMVLSISGIATLICYGAGALLAIVGAILGHVARKQIRERGEAGDGMALAGVIVGWITVALGVLGLAAIVIFFVWLANTDTSYTEPTTYLIRLVLTPAG
jgi:hypothetical protein